MNKLDKDYQSLIKDALINGVVKKDRTGTGTMSVFGRQIRHKMSEGFPLLTTKKMPFGLIAVELLWFLRGDTNIKFLLDYNCHIWDGDAYKGYEKQCDIHNVEPMEEEKFISAVKNGNNNEPNFIPDLTGYKLGDLGSIYGKQWRNWNGKWKLTEKDNTNFDKWSQNLDRKGVDQIQNLINDLKTNPDSRRLMVNAWNVGELDQMVLPPCHYGFQVYTRELSEDERYDLLTQKMSKLRAIRDEDYINYNIPTRAISLMFNMRSTDVGLGLPFNLASYGLLLLILAKEVNMIPDELIYSGGDVHIYSNHIDGLTEQLNREAYELPTVNILKDTVDDIGNYEIGDFEIINYKSHPTIKLPLSN